MDEKTSFTIPNITYSINDEVNNERIYITAADSVYIS